MKHEGVIEMENDAERRGERSYGDRGNEGKKVDSLSSLLSE